MQPNNKNFLRAIAQCEHFQGSRQGIPVWQAVLTGIVMAWFALTITLSLLPLFVLFEGIILSAPITVVRFRATFASPS